MADLVAKPTTNLEARKRHKPVTNALGTWQECAVCGTIRDVLLGEVLTKWTLNGEVKQWCSQ